MLEDLALCGDTSSLDCVRLCSRPKVLAVPYISAFLRWLEADFQVLRIKNLKILVAPSFS